MTEPIYLSFSEISSFLRCRQQWSFSSANQQSIRHKVSPALYLDLGSAVHKALEAQYAGEDPLQAVDDYMDAQRTIRTEAYVEEFKCKPWPSEMAKFEETAVLARAMVEQYYDHYGTDNPLADQGLTSIGCETPFKIDITDMMWPDNEWGPKVYFCGTIDNIAVDEHANIWTIENKTFSSKPSAEDIQWHFQAQGYAVAVEWLTGLPVAGVLYNGIAKKLITEPKVLKNGLLSVDKRQQTTYDRLAKAIRENGEDESDPRFSEILSHLRALDEQGDTRFFYREKAFFTREQLDAWREDFDNIVREMLDNPRIYRTIPFKGCGDCWYRDLCETKHSGGDVDYLLSRRYTQDSAYGTIKEVRGVEPQFITSVDDLKEYLRNG